MTLASLLQLPDLDGVQVLVDAGGLDRKVTGLRTSVGAGDAVLPGELVAIGYQAHDSQPRIDDGDGKRLLTQLAAAGAAALLLATDRVPKSVRSAADRLGLPLLAVSSWDRLAPVIQALCQALDRQKYELLEQSERILRGLTAAALEARDLKHITEALSRFLHRSVTVEDANYRVLANAEWDGAVDPIRAVTLSLGHTPPDVIKRCHADGIIGHLQKTNAPFLFPGYPDIGMNERILCPIRVSGDMVGYVDVLGGGRAFSPLDMRIAEHAATVIALHILRQQSVAEVEARVRHSFVDALLGGYFNEHDPEWSERARLFAFSPDRSHMVVIVTPLGHSRNARGRALEGRQDFQTRQRLRDAVQTALTLCGLPQFITYSLNRVVFFLPLPEGGPEALRHQVGRIFQRVQNEVGDLPFNMTCGEVHPGIAGLRRSLEEAEILTGLQEPAKTVLWYADALLLRLVGEATHPRVLADLVEATLGRLAGHSNGEALVQTVEALVAVNFRQTQAAQRLHIHRNSLLYRINLIERLLDGSLGDLKLQVQLYLALLARDVLRRQRTTGADDLPAPALVP